MTDIQKKILIVERRAPYGTSGPAETVDLAMMATAFSDNVSILLLDDGVLNLQASQEANRSGYKNLGKLFESLSLYGIDAFYVSKVDFDKQMMSPESLVLKPTFVSDADVTKLMRQADIVMSV